MVTGKVFKYGDNVDTDVIIPARYLNAPSPEELAKHCMEDIDPAFATTVQPGDIIVGGANFGCGSSREHAPISIRACGVRCIVIPATQDIYMECIKLGYTQIFIEAGCAVSTPTCGPCLGGHMGCMCEGERAVATTNRNFVGRMGHVKSEVILASPAVAAASAIKGCVASPKDI